MRHVIELNVGDRVVALNASGGDMLNATGTGALTGVVVEVAGPDFYRVKWLNAGWNDRRHVFTPAANLRRAAQ